MYAVVDHRWHTASLEAIFLALGDGVLMGGAVVGEGALPCAGRRV